MYENKSYAWFKLDGNEIELNYLVKRTSPKYNILYKYVQT